MLLFFSVILFFLILVLVIIFSELKIKINKFELLREKHNTDLKYNVKIGLYFLGKIPIFFYNFSEKKSSKFINKNHIGKIAKKLPKMNNNKMNLHKKTILNIIQKSVKITVFKLKMYVDTENVIITSYLVGIISIIIPNLLRKNIVNVNSEKFNYKIQPIYKNHNFIYLKLNSIFSIKLVHIINMLKVMGGNKNERTSNRKLNVNCYGKY